MNRNYLLAALTTLTLCLATFSANAQMLAPKAAIHLMTYQSWGYTVDSSSAQGLRVRHILEESARLGFKTVIFNFRGHMVTGTGSEIRSTVKPEEQATEERLLLETVRYAKSLGLSIAFRPILLVVGPKGEFPYVENRKYLWWHGNIRPKDPQTWFANYFKYHERYLKLATKAGAEWYSIGAEMNSMTSGLGERDPSWRTGFPKMWVDLIQKAHAIVGTNTKITYGLNYTDQYVVSGGQKIWGGEIEQWRNDIVETFTDPKLIQHQKDMRDLWSSLDIIGVDYYRALASSTDKFASDFATLANQLQARPQSHATQLDNLLTEVALTIGVEKPLYFQEVGYRSVQNCFLDPSQYESQPGKANQIHQAAAWEAFFRAYWQPRWNWMAGVGLWQDLVDVDPAPNDDGFSPFGKAPMGTVLQNYLK